MRDSAETENLEPMSQEVKEPFNTSVGSAGAARITLVRREGFPVPVLRRWFRRNVVPDVYCCIKMNPNDDVWRT